MTVAELIEKLKQFDQDLPVVVSDPMDAYELEDIEEWREGYGSYEKAGSGRGTGRHIRL